MMQPTPESDGDDDRWTVNPADEALEFENGKYAIASWDLHWHADANGSLPSHAHAALVRCVRDSEMLRRVREIVVNAGSADDLVELQDLFR